MKTALLLLLALLPLGSVRALEQPVTDPAQAREQYRLVLSRPEFRETAAPDPNERLHHWLSQWFTRLGEELSQFKYTQEMPRFASLLMTVLATLSLAGLLYVAARLARRNREHRDPDLSGTGSGTPLRTPEFYEEELRRAVAGGDWRGAWRASWRQFLARLEQDRLVETDRSRTNREYLAQLRARSLPAPALGLLSGLVDAYDAFIYGRKPIGEPDWNAFRRQVDEAALLLHLPEPPRTP